MLGIHQKFSTSNGRKRRSAIQDVSSVSTLIKRPGTARSATQAVTAALENRILNVSSAVGAHTESTLRRRKATDAPENANQGSIKTKTQRSVRPAMKPVSAALLQGKQTVPLVDGRSPKSTLDGLGEASAPRRALKGISKTKPRESVSHATHPVMDVLLEEILAAQNVFSTTKRNTTDGRPVLGARSAARGVMSQTNQQGNASPHSSSFQDHF